MALLCGIFGVVALLATLTSFEPTTLGNDEAKEDIQKVVLVIHGGAGVLTEAEMKDEKTDKGEPLKREHFEQALVAALESGYQILQQNNKTSVDAVEAAIRSLEDSGLFNAGRGAAFSHDGRVELDAALMEGNMKATAADRMKGKKDPRKRAGAVAGVSHIKNPISAARAVMEAKDQRSVMLVGDGAEWFALSESIKKPYKIEKVSNVYFWSDRRLKQIRKEIQGPKEQPTGNEESRGHGADRYLGTVGAVAQDRNGNLAAGTSTGGLTNKARGRVGDSPIIGAGTYADDRACGVSCTGTGEVFIRHAVAHDVVARMLYGNKKTVATAARETIQQLPDEEEGVGGLITLDKDGRHAFAMSEKSVGMYS
jgi:beta-aspartyl-peptidase (threonine type)